MSNGLLRVFKTTGLALALGISLSACAGFAPNTKGWKEEVLLHDGKIITAERFYNLGGYPGYDARERAALDETVTRYSNSSTGAASRPKVAGNARQCWSLAFFSNESATTTGQHPVSTDAANELQYARAA